MFDPKRDRKTTKASEATACRGRWSVCGGANQNVDPIRWHICNACSIARARAMAGGLVRPAAAVTKSAKSAKTSAVGKEPKSASASA